MKTRSPAIDEMSPGTTTTARTSSIHHTRVNRTHNVANESLLRVVVSSWCVNMSQRNRATQNEPRRVSCSAAVRYGVGALLSTTLLLSNRSRSVPPTYNTLHKQKRSRQTQQQTRIEREREIERESRDAPATRSSGIRMQNT